MDVRKVKMRNFQIHDKFELDSLESGITLITGPMGSGKSTFLEAVATAGWGRSVRNPKKQKTRGFRHGQTGEAALELADGLTITRKATKAGSTSVRFAFPGEETPRYATASKYQAALVEHIGTFDAWLRTSVFTSQSAHLFTMATDAGRREMIEDLIDLSELSEAFEIAKTRTKAIRKQHDSLANNVTELRLRETSAQEWIVQLEGIKREPPTPPEGYDASYPFDAKNTELVKARQKVQQHEDALRVSGKRDALCHRRDRLETSIRDLRKWEDLPPLPSTTELHQDDQRVSAEIETERAKLERILQARQDAEVQFAKLAEQTDRYKKDYHAISGGTCPTCHQSVPLGQIHHIQQQVEQHMTELRDVKHENESSATDAHELAEVVTKKLEELSNERAKIAAEIARVERELQKRKIHLQSLAETKDEHAQVMDELSRTSLVGAPAPEKMTKLRQAANDIATEITNQRNAHESVEYNRKEYERQENERLSSLEVARTRAKEAKEDADQAAIDLPELAHRLRVAELGVDILHPKGIRAHALGRALKGIDTMANQWLAKFDDNLRIELSPYSTGSKGEQRTAISLIIVGREAGDQYLDLSQGERRLVDFAVMLAMSEVYRLAHGINRWGTLWLDEILGPVSAEPAERVCQALQDLAKDRAIVIISHNNAVKQYLHPTQHVHFG